MEEFECIACGLCCANVGSLLDHEGSLGPKWDKLIFSFPYGAEEDGSCTMLLDSGKCACYQDRPDICNVATTKNIISPEMSTSDWNKLQTKACHELQREAGWTEKEIKEAYGRIKVIQGDSDKKGSIL